MYDLFDEQVNEEGRSASARYAPGWNPCAGVALHDSGRPHVASPAIGRIWTDFECVCVEQRHRSAVTGVCVERSFSVANSSRKRPILSLIR
ncbi:hypothetical protein PAECIP111893_00722 [Paenibacillus plantiphilus]|uniref:Uncharacterized protein n=1 Tax=Paenibacillus plantiphilus TaxID=2905650 RepID=A0ABN8G3Y5_9BACL|nr:hypothetical protein PAECIP111893_00722 [Paenibacillus plantiphilus]